MNPHYPTAAIEADSTVPLIRLTRDFKATPAQLLAAHIDPALFVRWVGPTAMANEVLRWDARSGGEWCYVARRNGEEYGFRGCFHTIAETKIIPDTISTPSWRWASAVSSSRSELAIC